MEIHLYQPNNKGGNMSKTQATIKISPFTHEVLKGVKDFTGKPITRIIEDLVRAEYPAKYKKALTKESK